MQLPRINKLPATAIFLAVASLSFAAVELPVPYLQQPDNQTCLPTCLTMALHFMGRESLTSDTVQKFQKRTQYNRYNVPGIVKDYNLYALPTWHELGWTRETVEHELDQGRPVILGLNQGPVGHFVLAIGYTNDHKIIIHDPWYKEPGWEFGGPHVVADWSQLNFRGGIMIHATPFPDEPKPAGKIVKEEYPKRMAPGETAQVSYEIRNTSDKPWPDGVFLAAIDPTSTSTERESAFFVQEDWLSPTRIKGPDKRNLMSSDTATFTFKIRAPQVAKATTFREHWNLIDKNGHWLNGRRLTMSEDHAAAFTIVVSPQTTATLPQHETSNGSQPSLPWQVKYGTITTDDTTTKPPDASRPWRLLTPGKTCDAAWLGNGAWTDYRVEAWVYCEMRPELKSEGFDRVGIFIRDNGQHAGDTKNETEIGECYAMTFDSDDGSIRAGFITNGSLDDFRPKAQRHKLTETGWHKFSIKCEGETLTYELDDKPFYAGKDKEFKSGECGIYYRSVLDSPGTAHGVAFAGFKAE